MHNPNLASILFQDQWLSRFEFVNVIPNSTIVIEETTDIACEQGEERGEKGEQGREKEKGSMQEYTNNSIVAAL